jgi:hypothetical protein
MWDIDVFSCSQKMKCLVDGINTQEVSTHHSITHACTHAFSYDYESPAYKFASLLALTGSTLEETSDHLVGSIADLYYSSSHATLGFQRLN